MWEGISKFARHFIFPFLPPPAPAFRLPKTTPTPSQKRCRRDNPISQIPVSLLPLCLPPLPETYDLATARKFSPLPKSADRTPFLPCRVLCAFCRALVAESPCQPEFLNRAGKIGHPKSIAAGGKKACHSSPSPVVDFRRPLLRSIVGSSTAPLSVALLAVSLRSLTKAGVRARLCQFSPTISSPSMAPLRREPDQTAVMRRRFSADAPYDCHDGPPSPPPQASDALLLPLLISAIGLAIVRILI